MRAVVAILVALAVSNAEPAGHLVQIDVSAVNARGQTVLDLKPGDFQLREEGAAQAVDGVRLVRGEPRLVAVFLDEYHVDASATECVEDADRAPVVAREHRGNPLGVGEQCACRAYPRFFGVVALHDVRDEPVAAHRLIDAKKLR
jgi:hypothetical protein